MSERVIVGGLERLYTMSDVDRLCSQCQRPHMALMAGGSTCPRCGCPATDADNIERNVARALRKEMGLIP